MQTTTSRLSLEGAFIRCLVSPRVGAPVQLQLTLPGSPAPVPIASVVSERVEPGAAGKEAGFWLRFEGLGREARTLLEALLTTRGGPPKPARPAPTEPARPAPSENRRSFSRVRTRLQVGWSSPREFLVAYSENMSRGGIFVSTPNPPPLREVVELMMELPDGKPPVRTKAEVVHSVSEAQAVALGCPAGVGLQFVGGDDEFRARLDACIDHLLGNKR